MRLDLALRRVHIGGQQHSINQTQRSLPLTIQQNSQRGNIEDLYAIYIGVD